MRLITKLKDWQPLSLPVFLSILIFNKTQPFHKVNNIKKRERSSLL